MLFLPFETLLGKLLVPYFVLSAEMNSRSQIVTSALVVTV